MYPKNNCLFIKSSKILEINCPVILFSHFMKISDDRDENTDDILNACLNVKCCAFLKQPACEVFHGCSAIIDQREGLIHSKHWQDASYVSYPNRDK